MERRSANEVLQALKALQSVTEAGVNYQEYSRRALDAKVQVDRYIQSEGGDAMIKSNVRAVMDLYVLASFAWNTKITENYIGLLEHPDFDLCPAAKPTREQAERMRQKAAAEILSVDRIREILASNSMSLLWGCASERIYEIEREFKTP